MTISIRPLREDDLATADHIAVQQLDEHSATVIGYVDQQVTNVTVTNQGSGYTALTSRQFFADMAGQARPHLCHARWGRCMKQCDRRQRPAGGTNAIEIGVPGKVVGSRNARRRRRHQARPHCNDSARTHHATTRHVLIRHIEPHPLWQSIMPQCGRAQHKTRAAKRRLRLHADHFSGESSVNSALQRRLTDQESLHPDQGASSSHQQARTKYHRAHALSNGDKMARNRRAAAQRYPA